MKCVLQIAIKAELQPLLSKTHIINKKPFVATSISVKNDEYLFVISGIGKTRAAAAAQWAICKLAPDHIWSIGTAGALDRSLQQGKIFKISSTAMHDTNPISKTYKNRQTSSNIFAKNIEYQNLKTSMILTGDREIITTKQVDDCLNRFPEAKLVDMETAAIAEVCHKNQVAWGGIKIISDNCIDFSIDDFMDNLDSLSHKLSDIICKIIEIEKDRTVKD
jgi:adenosylhomocysteine nucleosidase